MKNIYKVSWCKTYYCHGEEEIQAESSEEAEKMALDKMGDYEGRMQYDPNEDYIDVYPQDTEQ